jgi:hypothetical protein
LNNKNKIIEETYDDVESDDGQRRTATRFWSSNIDIFFICDHLMIYDIKVNFIVKRLIKIMMTIHSKLNLICKNKWETNAALFIKKYINVMKNILWL